MSGPSLASRSVIPPADLSLIYVNLPFSLMPVFVIDVLTEESYLFCTSAE